MSSSFRRGEVLLVDLGFASGVGSKKRPVLVITELDDLDLLVLPVTSHPARGEFDYPLKDWSLAGLKLPSTVRINKFATVSKSAVIKKLGTVQSTDSGEVNALLKRFCERLTD